MRLLLFSFFAVTVLGATSFPQLAVEKIDNQVDETSLKTLYDTINHCESSLRREYAELDTADKEYPKKVDYILRQLIQLNSPIAIDLCALHLNNPFSDDLMYHIGGHPSCYMRYLCIHGNRAIRTLLGHVHKNKLSNEELELYLQQCAYLVANTWDFKETKILKYQDILREDYSPKYVDKIVSAAILIKKHSR